MTGARIPDPAISLKHAIWRGGGIAHGRRQVAEETPIAFSYNRATLAVMLATPADLDDFALGFSLTEGIVTHPDQIEETAIVAVANGIELRLWLSPDRAAAAETRRRHLAGPGGCGLCGIDSLEAANRAPLHVAADPRIGTAEIAAAVASLAPAQTLNAATRATHAAGFWTRAEGLVAVREDVGRHNALDKLAGALARAGRAAADGVVLLSSRLSVELVQKAAMIGAPVLVAVSAPTALAIRTAEAAGITLVGIARADGFEIFTHAHRIAPAEEASRHVA